MQPAFVGRESELARLRLLMQQVRAGRSCLVLVEGPAGIGKTALVHEFLDLAGEGCVLWASGEESEGGLPLGVVAQLVSRVPAAVLDPSAAAFKGDDSPVDPLVAGAALIDMLGKLQQPGPVVLVVDDAHWADQPSLVALTFALRRLHADRVLTLVISRDRSDLRLPEGLRRLLTDRRHALQLSLGGLQADELRSLSTRPGVGPLSARAAARLRAHTDGNPLHARALLEQLPADALDNPDVPLPAPRSFALLVVARLAGCGAEAQELVAAASVLDTRFPLHLAAGVAQLDEPLPALEQAITAGLLVEEPNGGAVRFAHPLVRAAVFEQIGPARRAGLHTRAAGLAEDEATRLRHRAAAASGPDAALAADLAQLGRREVVAGSPAAAANHLSTAARLTPSRADREQLVVEATECRLLAGDIVDSAAVSVGLHALSPTAWRSYVLARLALVAGRFTEAEALLRDAWRRCDAGTEPALATRVAAQMATLCLLQARGQNAVKWADLALRLAPRHSATDLLRFVRLAGLGISGHADAALATLHDVPDPAVASAGELDTLAGRGLLRIWTDDLIGARQDLAGVLATGHDRSVVFRLSAADLLGEAEYRLGHWDDAVVHNDLAMSIATDADQPWLAPLCHATATLLLAARGEWQQAAVHAETAGALAAASGNLIATAYAAAAAAQLARVRAEPEGVIAVLDPLLQLKHGDSIKEPGVICWQDLLVDALVAVGDLDRAEAVLSEFEALTASRQRRSAMAAAARARGNLTAARGDTTAATIAFNVGLDHAARVDMPFDRAVLQLTYGAFLRRAGKRAAAGVQLEAAQAVFERLGARPYQERCERELAACGRSPTRRQTADRTRLTPQEQAVARLVAGGLTNQQAARELVLSVKTVEYHLGHVYAKLQVTSRDQLADGLTQHLSGP
ncbi:AAA family ATPase [Pseudofrankia sp. BMG5.37]|uniref:AAA family ATPase n=1 Tax=Pseudofrankia sp. BMG5.37 TaxID=3050035 RepID=UPI002894D090|nr:AAA family ATPase [Pseudofrankia sp. BMG5.37]MDT3446047.1 AAA family ATPase [Pseudofrankia sp. BMG5.37]